MRARWLVGVAAVGLIVGGCSTEGAQPEDDVGSPLPTSVPSGTPRSGDDVGLDEPSEDFDQPHWDEETRGRLVQTATEAVEAFARPDLPYDQWWEAFSPYLSGSARGAFATVEPATIPISRVTGEPQITDETSPYLAWVEVPVDVGGVAVLLSRDEHRDPWLVEDIERV